MASESSQDLHGRSHFLGTSQEHGRNPPLVGRRLSDGKYDVSVARHDRRQHSRSKSEHRSPTQSQDKLLPREGNYQLGDRVQIFSHSSSSWVHGSIANIREGGYIDIEYELGDRLFAKTLHVLSHDLMRQAEDLSGKQLRQIASLDDEDEENVFDVEHPVECDPGLWLPWGKKRTHVEDNIVEYDDGRNNRVYAGVYDDGRTFETFFNRLNKAKEVMGKDIILVFGETGVGKSTFISYLAGLKMMENSQGDIDVASGQKQIVHICHGQSQTLCPIVLGLHGLSICDCPGFFDTRGAAFDAANAASITALCKAAKSVRCIGLIRYPPGGWERNSRKSIGILLGLLSQFQPDSRLLGIITRPQKKSSFNIDKELENARRKGVWNTDDWHVLETLRQHGNIFDSDSKSKSRINVLLAKIKGMTPRSGSYIQIPLSSDGKEELCREVTRRTESAIRFMKAKNFKATAEAFCRLEELKIVGFSMEPSGFYEESSSRLVAEIRHELRNITQTIQREKTSGDDYGKAALQSLEAAKAAFQMATEGLYKIASEEAEKAWSAIRRREEHAVKVDEIRNVRDTEQQQETKKAKRRLNAADGIYYTKQEFLEYFGEEDGLKVWKESSKEEQATPKESNAAAQREAERAQEKKRLKEAKRLQKERQGKEEERRRAQEERDAAARREAERAEETRRLEEAKRQEQERQVIEEERRRAQEERDAAARREAERAEETRRLEEGKRQEQERRVIEEERRRAQEERDAAAQREAERAEETRRLEEAKRQEQERRVIEEERRRAQEADEDLKRARERREKLKAVLEKRKAEREEETRKLEEAKRLEQVKEEERTRAQKAHVEVLVGMESDSKVKVYLPAGTTGKLIRTDEDGDALIKFDGIKKSHWIFKKNFHNLAFEKAPEVGAVVKVLKDIKSLAVHLPEGTRGRLEQIDEDGDARIYFYGFGLKWILKKNFHHLIFLKTPEAADSEHEDRTGASSLSEGDGQREYHDEDEDSEDEYSDEIEYEGSQDETLSQGEAHVEVLEGMQSDSKDKVHLQKGTTGKLIRTDEDGDALIKFDGIAKRQWIFKKNFHNLAFEKAALWWAPISKSGGPPHWTTLHLAIHSAATSRMYLFGSSMQYGIWSDVWELDLATQTWTSKSTRGNPFWDSSNRSQINNTPGRIAADSAIHATATNRMYIFGKGDYSSWETKFKDVWELDLATQTWTYIFTSIDRRAEGGYPDQRRSHSATYATSTNKMYILGGDSKQGANGGGLLNDVWELDIATRSWRSISTSGGPPAKRRGHSAIHVTATNRMYIFGGRGHPEKYFCDVWELCLATQTWTSMATNGCRPPGRYAHSAIHSTTTNSMYIFGGHGHPQNIFDGSTESYNHHLKDVWELDLARQTWKLISTRGSCHKLDHSCVVDHYMNDLWELQLKAGGAFRLLHILWELQLKAPEVGAVVKVLKDMKFRTYILPEGTRGRLEEIDEDGDAYIDFDDVGPKWILKGNFHYLDFLKTPEESDAAARREAERADETRRLEEAKRQEQERQVIEEERRRAQEADGYLKRARERREKLKAVLEKRKAEREEKTRQLEEAKRLEQVKEEEMTRAQKAKPQQLFNVGDEVMARDYKEMRSAEIVAKLPNDHYELNLTDWKGNRIIKEACDISCKEATLQWSAISTSGGPPSWNTLHISASASRMYIFGSTLRYGMWSDVWMLDLATQIWTSKSTSGKPPGKIAADSAIHATAMNRMYIFGPGDCTSWETKFEVVWELDLATQTWTFIPTSGDFPSQRRSHSSVYVSMNRMCIFGGKSAGWSGSLLNDVWELDLAKQSWTSISTSGGPPAARRGHSAIYITTTNTMYIFGGLARPENYLNDVWELCLVTHRWTSMATNGCRPHGRYAHSAIHATATNRMYIFGGKDGSSKYLNDIWELDLARETWTFIPTSGPPCGRKAHAAIHATATNRMYIFGGSRVELQHSGLDDRYMNDLWELDLKAELEIGDRVKALPGKRFEFDGVVFYEEQDVGSIIDFWDDKGSPRLSIMWERTGKSSNESRGAWRNKFSFYEKAIQLEIGDRVKALPGKRYESSGVVFYEESDLGTIMDLRDDGGTPKLIVEWDRSGKNTHMSRRSWRKFYTLHEKSNKAHVEVLVGMESNSKKKVYLPAGTTGKLIRTDEDGDALIKFNGILRGQWIFKKNFHHLAFEKVGTPANFTPGQQCLFTKSSGCNYPAHVVHGAYVTVLEINPTATPPVLVQWGHSGFTYFVHYANLQAVEAGCTRNPPSFGNGVGFCLDKPEASRLEGEWYYNGKGGETKYKLSLEDGENIIFREGSAEGRLRLRGGWFEGNILSAGIKVRTVRLRLNEAGNIVSQFKNPFEDGWGNELIASKRTQGGNVSQRSKSEKSENADSMKCVVGGLQPWSLKKVR